MARKKHIVVLDDDPWIRELLTSALEEGGFRVTTCSTGSRFWSEMESNKADLVILDLNLPDDDGLVICRTLRSRSTMPILILTSRSDEVERVIGLEMGADDYLVKPVFPRELLARVKALLRRVDSQVQKETENPEEMFQFSEWSLYSATRRLVSPNGRTLALTTGEYRLLRVLLLHPNRVLNRDVLLDLTQGREADSFDRSIDNMIARLRRRLRGKSEGNTLIQTVRGAGYKLVGTVERLKEDSEAENRAADGLGGSAFALGSDLLLMGWEPVSRMSLAAMVRQSGARVRVVEDGTEAYSAWQEREWDLVIVQWRSDETSKSLYQAFRQVEEGSGRYAPPVILFGPPTAPEQWGQYGDDFLSLPATQEGTLGVLWRWLSPGHLESGGDAMNKVPVDRAWLRRLRELLDSRLDEMIKAFIESVPAHLDELDGLMGQPEEVLQSVVNDIQAGALTLGAADLSARCDALKAIAPDSGQVAEAVTALKREGEKVCAFLQGELDSE
ncbi:MAG: response regulator [Magnetococcales bacterium]|nr:response regulator [Magnetococcales bacterium]